MMRLLVTSKSVVKFLSSSIYYYFDVVVVGMMVEMICLKMRFCNLVEGRMRFCKCLVPWKEALNGPRATGMFRGDICDGKRCRQGYL